MTTQVTTKQQPITKSYDFQTIIDDIINKAKEKGASAAEVAASAERGFSVTARMGEVETLEHNRDKGLSISVYFGQKKGTASTSDITPESVDAALEKACHIANYISEDDCEGLADKELMAFEYPQLDLHHPSNISPEQGLATAIECEQHGLKQDKRLFNSEGATFASHESFYVYGNSHGFVGAYPTSRHSLSCILLAKEQNSMERDYEYTVARDIDDMVASKEVAEGAAERTLRRLNARKIKTCQAPVVFAANVARGLLGHLISAISGGSLYREASFLLDHLGKEIFSDDITISENPHMINALGSAPFDNEGVKTQARDIIKDGVLQAYVLGSYSARKLGMQTTGNAGGVHNLTINTGDDDLAALLKKMDKGLLVTEMLGSAVNIVTGDYSRGAVGIWVENGEMQFPVHEITIAGHLKEMFKNIVAVGNDIDKRGNIITGSILVENMTIAGS